MLANVSMQTLNETLKSLLLVIPISPPALAAAAATDAAEHKRNAASTPAAVCQLAAGRRRGFVKYPHCTAEKKYDSWSHILAVRWQERSCVSCKENIKIARYILFTPNSKEVKMAPNTTDKEIKR